MSHNILQVAQLSDNISQINQVASLLVILIHLVFINIIEYAIKPYRFVPS